MTHTEVTRPSSYNAQDHTVTVEGDWPVCAGCDEYGSHEDCGAEENLRHRAQRSRLARTAAGAARPGTGSPSPPAGGAATPPPAGHDADRAALVR